MSSQYEFTDIYKIILNYFLFLSHSVSQSTENRWEQWVTIDMSKLNLPGLLATCNTKCNQKCLTGRIIFILVSLSAIKNRSNEFNRKLVILLIFVCGFGQCWT